MAMDRLQLLKRESRRRGLRVRQSAQVSSQVILNQIRKQDPYYVNCISWDMLDNSSQGHQEEPTWSLQCAPHLFPPRISFHSELRANASSIEGDMKMRRKEKRVKSDEEVSQNQQTSGLHLEPILGPQFLDRESQQRLAELMTMTKASGGKASDEDLPEIGETGKHLIYSSDSSREHKTRTYLGIALPGEEWAALFYEVLGCPDPGEYPYSPGEDVDQYEDRYKKVFQDSIPSYQMLSRIWDMYTDVEYQPDEINQLQAECLRAKLITSNPMATQWLAKLLRACDAALQSGLGLFLASD
jgi:hypothetical protein